MKHFDSYDLYIFDLDDTIVKTEHLHYDAWIKTLKHFISEDFYITKNFFLSKFHCISPDTIVKYLSEELNIPNYQDAINYKNELYYKLISEKKNTFQLIDGLSNYLENIIKLNKEFVIVSNSLKSNIDFFSDLFPILKKSSKNYYREIIKNKKPNPECYLTVVKDFPSRRMIGFEDSITGIHAITAVPEIKTMFINTSDYYHYDYIMKNYNIRNIQDYNNLV
jgi:beta-phosphoglucomutase-like phosphatase (HAD superfamily)